MTLRRLLRKNKREKLPEKYQQLLAVLGTPQPTIPAKEYPSFGLQKNFEELLSELETSGKQIHDLRSLRKDLMGKLSLTKFGREFKNLVTVLIEQASGKGTLRHKALAAEPYFILLIRLMPSQTRSPALDISMILRC